jgi:hypothetical protein
MRRVVLSAVILCGAALLLPSPAQAQVAIAGVVKDGTGAVMPGVNVEASSPALIEKTRTVVTDGAGQYKIVDLRPGIYEVSFTLPGFKTFRRGNIILEGTFTATVNAELQVGAVEESVQVTAASPIVDVSGSTVEFVANRQVLDDIPTPIRNTPARALLIPGTTVTPFVLGQYNLTSHGSATSDFTMAIRWIAREQSVRQRPVQRLLHERRRDPGTELSHGGGIRRSAEQRHSRQPGAERRREPFLGRDALSVPGQRSAVRQPDRLDEGDSGERPAGRRDRRHRVRLADQSVVRRARQEDKVWFYFTYKYQDHKNYVPSSKFPDGTQAFRNDMGSYAASGRLTWAPDEQGQDSHLHREAVQRRVLQRVQHLRGDDTLKRPPTRSVSAGFRRCAGQRRQSNKLLFEAGIAQYNQAYEQNCSRTATNPTALPKWNLSTGLLSGRCGYLIPPYTSETDDYNVLASASYVTGTHAIKVGMTNLWGENSRTFAPRANINTLITINTVVPGTTIPLIDFPAAVSVYNSPATSYQNVNSDLGLFAQDAWTMQRLTLHYGARFEHFDASIPAESSPASTWIGARNFPEVRDVPHWNDWAIRFAANYDLTGDGKTSLKGNVGKYVAAAASGFAQTFNGMSGTLTGVPETRTWNDANGDKTILNADGSIQTNEVLGGTSSFGQVTSRPDPNLPRGYNWEYSLVLQRELRPRLSASAGYYRRDFYNIQVNDNLNVGPSDWISYTVNTPTDSRLPLSGQPITLYTLNPTKVGVATDNLATYTTGNKVYYDGVEFTVNARGTKYLLFGGVTTDRRVSTTCDGDTSSTTVRDTPFGQRFCASAPPFRTTVKASGRLFVPQGHPAQRYVFGDSCRQHDSRRTTRSRRPSRPARSSRPRPVTTRQVVNLIETGSLYLDTPHRFDLRIGKTLPFRPAAHSGFMDVFNVFNINTVTSGEPDVLGDRPRIRGLTPTGIVEGRFIRSAFR